LIVPLKQGNSPWRTLWRKAKRQSTDPIEGNMLNPSRFLSHVNVTRSDNYRDHLWMVNLSIEEPDALMCARPGLWEPRVGNDPGPPGQFLERLTQREALRHCRERTCLTRNRALEHRLRSFVTTRCQIPICYPAIRFKEVQDYHSLRVNKSQGDW